MEDRSWSAAFPQTSSDLHGVCLFMCVSVLMGRWLVVLAETVVSSPTAPRPSGGTTDREEASRILAENRRLAREQREREEEQRREQEEQQRYMVEGEEVEEEEVACVVGFKTYSCCSLQ